MQVFFSQQNSFFSHIDVCLTYTPVWLCVSLSLSCLFQIYGTNKTNVNKK